MFDRICAVTTALFCGSFAAADVFYDAVGDIAVGDSNLDITQVEVTNDDSNLYMTVSLNGWQNWTKVLLFLEVPGEGTVSGFDNPWDRGITTDWNVSNFVGSYFDAGNVAQNWSLDAFTWQLDYDTTPAVDQGLATITYTLSLGDLGLNAGDTLSFDVATTGSNMGDPGIDLASTSTVQPGWNEGFSQSITPLTYTLGSTPVVPGIGGIAALAGFGLAGRRRRR